MSETLEREEVRMKGSVIFVHTVGTSVDVWMSSPTGDSSDSHIVHIPCHNVAQAEAVARLWKGVWGL